jgi:hypothetical protein
MSFLIHAYSGRTKDYTGALTDDDSAAQNLALEDVVRIKIGTNGQAPDLDIDSDQETGNGSIITFTAGSNAYSLHIDGRDLAVIGSGAYDCEVNVVDASETGRQIKHAEYGVLFVHPTQTGILDLEESSSSASSTSSGGSSDSSSTSG